MPYFDSSLTINSFSTTSLPNKKLEEFCKAHDFKYISTHGFRHTHCSLLFSAGLSIAEVQDRMGHKDIKTTMNIYNHVFSKDKQEAHKKFIQAMNKL